MSSKVTVNGYTYRSTIAAMGGTFLIPLRRSNREAAGIEGGAAPPAWDRWRELSFSHQREYAESIQDARKPETRARRIENAVKAIAKQHARKRNR